MKKIAINYVEQIGKHIAVGNEVKAENKDKMHFSQLAVWRNGGINPAEKAVRT